MTDRTNVANIARTANYSLDVYEEVEDGSSDVYYGITNTDYNVLEVRTYVYPEAYKILHSLQDAVEEIQKETKEESFLTH